MKNLHMPSIQASLGVPAAVLRARHGSSLDGNLFKIGWKNFAWKQRYCVLAQNFLVYYETPESALPKGVIFLEYARIAMCDRECYGKPHCFMVSIPEMKEYMFHAPNSINLQEWFDALTNAQYNQLERQLTETRAILAQLNRRLILADDKRASHSPTSPPRPLIRLSALSEDPTELFRLSTSVCDSDTTATKQGFLFKRGVFNRRKRRRWCVLYSTTLNCYKDQEDVEPANVIPLELCILREVNDASKEYGPGFELVNTVSDRTYSFAGSDLFDTRAWTTVISQAIEVQKKQTTKTKTL
eukprot:c12902_g1_i2.p1 GENE.c12902_g1_i2~~c12902_g1_i2.p1  ORF type:complete len:299 (+),score=69.94 c12902_g1_i2:15-911(+)